MTADPKNMSCQEFQAQLADLIASGEDLDNHPHLQRCATCRALLTELETIAEAARKLFPIEQPKEDLWERIELAIKQDEGSTQPD